MRNHSNTILITGGGAGIGRGVPQTRCSVPLDISNSASIQAVAHSVLSRFPDLNCLINNAGLQRVHDQHFIKACVCSAGKCGIS
jgi:short-subunit dehydrogenase involved in D-alanine esterification of teichoic acids